MNKTDIIKLNMIGLPVIQSLDDFSEITHISKYTLFQLSKNADYYYKTYTIPKKSGKPRTISQPSKKLKGLQAWLLVYILNKLSVSSSSKGFEKGSSTLRNAEPHRGAYVLLNMDLKDFFPSITQKQVFNVFKSIGYNDTMAIIFSNICTFNDTLPQGGPCSPKLANLCAWQMDLRIQGFVGQRGISYSRYADDLSFSGINPQKVVQILPMIKYIVEDENFKMNNSKTRIAGPSKAKIVTGLVLSEDAIGVGAKKFKEIRSKIFHLTLDDEQDNMKLLFEVSGWLAYLNSVDVRRLNKAKKYIKELIAKHPSKLIAQLVVKN